MSKMKDDEAKNMFFGFLTQEQELEYAVEMFKIKGFSPSVIGYNLYLECWNDDLTEAYHVGISRAEIEHQADEYLKYLKENA